jgi:hypothetical protein
VGRLVYLAAAAPQDGMCLADFDLGPDSAMRAIAPGPAANAFRFDAMLAAEVFYNTCSPSEAAAAVARLKQQSTAPLSDRIRLTAKRWGAVPKTYLFCTQDWASPPATQEWLCDRQPGMRRRSSTTDQSPCLCAPEALADLLAEEALAVD